MNQLPSLAPRHRIAYPTWVQTELVCSWANKGPNALDAETVPGQSRNTLYLRDLIYRLDLPPEFDGMRSRMRPRYEGIHAAVGNRLLDQLLVTLRYHGYIYPTGPLNAEHGRPYFARTPLTGYRLHLLRLLASGSNQSDLAPVFGVQRQTISDALLSTREDFGCSTTVQLVAMAYGRRWLPTFDETLSLTRGSVRPQGKAFRVMPGSVGRTTRPQGRPVSSGKVPSS